MLTTLALMVPFEWQVAAAVAVIGILAILWSGLLAKPVPGRSLISIALLVGLGAVVLFGRSSRNGGVPMQEPQVRVNNEWILHSVKENKEVKLSEMKGKVLFINIWATWCPPCVAEMPSLQRLYDTFKDDPNIDFLFVSVDQDPGAVSQFVAAKRFTMPMYMATSPIPRVFKTEGIPATFILGKDRSLIHFVLGAQEWDGPTEKEMLRKAMAKAYVAESNGQP